MIIINFSKGRVYYIAILHLFYLPKMTAGQFAGWKIVLTYLILNICISRVYPSVFIRETGIKLINSRLQLGYIACICLITCRLTHTIDNDQKVVARRGHLQPAAVYEDMSNERLCSSVTSAEKCNDIVNG